MNSPLEMNSATTVHQHSLCEVQIYILVLKTHLERTEQAQSRHEHKELMSINKI